MTPQEFEAALCASVISRLDAQYIKGKATRTKAALHMLCGAAAALNTAQSEHYNGIAIVAWLTSARGMEVVEKLARGEPL